VIVTNACFNVYFLIRMASVGDIHNFGDQFKYQLDKLDDADIDERDRKAIKELIRYQDTQRNLAASTNVNN